jgi:hypothetical protein
MRLPYFALFLNKNIPMNPGTALSSAATQYDDCLLSSCLRKLFSGKAKNKAETSFIVSNHVAAVKKELDQLNGGVTELSYAYLQAMELSVPGPLFYYAVVYKEGLPVLFAWFQLFTLTSRNFRLEKDKGFVKRIIHLFLELKKVSVLMSGNALRNDTPCYCYKDACLGKAEAAELVASIAEKIAADECASALILKDIPFTAHQQQWLADIGFSRPWEDQEMVLDINKDWTSLAHYTDALSRKYKARAKKILESANGLAIKNLSGDDIVANSVVMYQLFKNVTDNQSFLLTRPEANHFALMKDIYQDNFEVIGFYNNDELVAFYSAFITGASYELYYVGLNYEINSQYQLYFNLLFSGLERAITLKKKILKTGRTSFDAKASMGARPAELSYYSKTGNIPNAVTKWFANYFAAMEDGKWKQRNPLK